MKRFTLAILALVVSAGAQAASDEVEMNLVTPQGVKRIKGWNLPPRLTPFLRANMASTFTRKAPASQR